ncbi:hypothetical protein ACWC2K_04125 [Streptomyces chattanoogensis]
MLLPAHQQFGGPIFLLWANLNTPLASGMREFIVTPDHLVRTIVHGLRRIQSSTELIDGCLAGSGLGWYEHS